MASASLPMQLCSQVLVLAVVNECGSSDACPCRAAMEFIYMQQGGQGGFELGAVYDGIDKAMILKVLGGLEAFG
jgi:hypothetical protein